MQRNTIVLIWTGGILVALFAYATDPSALLNAALDLVAAAIAAIERLVAALSAFGSDVVRALAIGFFATFVALSVLAIRQGGKGRMALFAVSTVFVLLLRGDGGASNENWVAAFALAAVGALVMTTRVRRRSP
jgi:hypothetical protein